MNGAGVSDLITFLNEQYAAELAAFRAALDAVPEERFAQASPGHSPAWQALHVAEWLRLGVLGDRSATYGHLGWEDQAWAQELRVNPAIGEDAGKGAVLAHLDGVSQRVLTFVQHLTAADLAGKSFSPSAPNGERPRLQGLGLHLRHVAYHRGQAKL